MTRGNPAPRPGADIRVRQLIQEQTRPLRPPLTPELEIWGADDYSAIWSATEERLAAMALPPPFWAFAWPGGQALARHLLDNPTLAAGKAVLALAAGAGLEAIAAARTGAARAVANDIDPTAGEAARLNAERNAARVEVCVADLLHDPAAGRLDPREADVVLLGDALYERALADAFLSLLVDAARRGATVLIAGPDRGFHPASDADFALEALARRRVPTRIELEDCAYRDVTVMRLHATA